MPSILCYSLPTASGGEGGFYKPKPDSESWRTVVTRGSHYLLIIGSGNGQRLWLLQIFSKLGTQYLMRTSLLPLCYLSAATLILTCHR